MKQGWEIKILDDVCTFERGLTYAKGDEVNISSKGVLRSNNVDLSTNTLNFDEIKYLREDFEIPAKKKVRKNSLLMCISNGSKIHLGKVALIDDDIDYAFGGFMGLLIPDETIIHPRYFYYSLISPMYKSFVKGLSDGANINNLKFADIKSFSIAVPPLTEQERIVEILDREFESIDALKANAERNLQHAKDLFQSALKQELQPKEGWSISTLGDVCDIQGGSTPKRTEKAFWDNGTYPWFTVEDIREQGRIITDTKQKITKLAWEKLRVFPKNTVLLCCTASLGEYALTKIPLTSNQQFNGLSIKDENLLNPMYLLHYCSTLKDKLLALSGKATIDFVATGKVKQIEISFPSLVEQGMVVARLDKLKEHCSALEENYTKTIALCDDMKQALLRKAFNGEL